MILRAVVALNILAILSIMLIAAAGGDLSSLNAAIGAGAVALHAAFLCFCEAMCRHATR